MYGRSSLKGISSKTSDMPSLVKENSVSTSNILLSFTGEKTETVLKLTRSSVKHGMTDFTLFQHSFILSSFNFLSIYISLSTQ